MNTVRLKPHLRERVRKVAEGKGISVSEAHRQALERYCDEELKETGASRYDDVVGVIEGPPDLAARSSEMFVAAMAQKHARHSH